MCAKPLYEIQNLKHRYERGPTTLDIDSLSLNEGSVTGLVGPNGSGKSTLLKILAFLEPISEGKLLFDGADSTGREAELRRCVTYLLQSSYLLKRTVYENIAYGLRLRGETEGMEERIRDSMRKVGLAPEKFENRLWYRLSGGEIQRAALATRLALHPKVLLLDEPTANVDETSAQLVKEAALSAWKEWGTTVIVATHDLVWLYEVSTDIVSLYRGRVVGRGAENLILGKWRREDGRTALTLTDGQRIYGTGTGQGDTAAGIVNPSSVMVTRIKPEADARTNLIRGIVTQMALERSTGNILISVDAGDVIIKARLAAGHIERELICPASSVWLRFSQDDIRWI